MANIINPNAEDITEQLDRILQSKEFINATRSSSFLKFIVQNTLEGKEDQIKGYTIGIEVFDKPEDFNPDTDASVRVEATRLRKSLALYYHDEGKNDSIVIKIPKGRYKPFFYERTPQPADNNTNNEPKTSPQSDVSTASNNKARLISGILIACLIVLLSVFSYHMNSHNGAEAETDGQHATNGPMAPTIAVLPFYAVGDVSAQQLSNDLSHKITSKLSRFDSLYALNSATVSAHKNWQGHSAEIAETLDADYLIEGTIKKQIQDIRVSIRILDLYKSKYIWSYDQTHEVTTDDMDGFLDDLSSEIVSKLGSPYGIIQSQEYARTENSTGKAAQAYKCVLDTYVYANNQKQEMHKAMRACMEKTVKNYPLYIEAWALLSYLYAEEFRFNFNPRKFGKPAEIKALEAAQKAININPNSARAHQYMAEASKLYRNEGLIRHHTKIALSLNKNDSEILANAGWTYGELGEWEKARMMTQRAISLNPGHPRWYEGVLFAYHFHKGEYENALLYALRFYQDEDLFSQIAVAVSYAGLHRTSEAAKSAKTIETNFPEFLEKPRKFLRPLGFRNEFIEKILIGAEAAGINFTEHKAH